MQKDIQLEADDLAIKAGDFVIDESDLQNAYLVIRTYKGNWKQFPLIGFGEERLVNSPVNEALQAALQKALQADGIRPKKLTIEDGVVDILL